ncbi:MAG: ACP S-malonyltransferase [Phycisphaeraceae bacterium]|nr:MAG: ACP S-malonyltransferase [Phycisphaeraceae bacterium]
MTILCPGQGAQAVGMGKAWASSHPESRAVFDRADAVLGDTLGMPLSELCFNGPAERLNKTDAAQPAIYVTSVASWHGVCAVAGHDPADAPLAAAAGLSLGEYTALHVAGAISFEDGLKLVALRGRAMQDAAEASPSSMVALIGADEDSASELCERVVGRLKDEPESDRVLVPANFNAPGQVVISGSVAACDLAEQLAGEAGLKATRLTVAGAFHSPLMAPAADRLRAALESVEITTPRCPVLSNVTGAPHATEPASIAERLIEQLTSPVRWAADCSYINEHILPRSGAVPYELAPGKTLAGLMRRIDREVKVTSHDTPA